MRQDNQLEALKQRIAESARKAGLDGEMGVEKTIKVRHFIISHEIKSHRRCFS